MAFVWSISLNFRNYLEAQTWRELRHDDACRDGKQNPDTDNHHEKKPFLHWGKC
jgi:hypothetical protein